MLFNSVETSDRLSLEYMDSILIFKSLRKTRQIINKLCLLCRCLCCCDADLHPALCLLHQTGQERVHEVGAEDWGHCFPHLWIFGDDRQHDPDYFGLDHQLHREPRGTLTHSRLLPVAACAKTDKRLHWTALTHFTKPREKNTFSSELLERFTNAIPSECIKVCIVLSCRPHVGVSCFCNIFLFFVLIIFMFCFVFLL